MKTLFTKSLQILLSSLFLALIFYQPIQAHNQNNLAAISTAMYGGNFEDNLKSAVISELSKQGANLIGDSYVGGDLGYFGHKGTHALLGCISARAREGDCNSGALGGMLGEAFAEQIGSGNLSDGVVLALSQLAVLTAVSGLGGDVNDSHTTGTNAIQNNYLSNRQKINMKNELSSCEGVSCKMGVLSKYGIISTKQDIALAKGLVEGLGEGILNEVGDLIELLQNPVQAIEGLKAVLEDPSLMIEGLGAELEEAKGLLSSFEKNYEQAGWDGSTEAGEDLGKLAAKILALVGTTGTGVGGVGYVGSKITSKIIKKVTDKIKKTFPKHNYQYNPRIRARGIQDPKGHNFPYSFDDEILKVKPIKQSDGSLLYRKLGTINGKKGYFELAVNPNKKQIFHRSFVGN